MRTVEIDIVIPVLNDLRILETIASVRFFDDRDSVRLVIMAGKSTEEFLSQLRPLMHDRDVLDTVPDAGIFDALNKGLAHCTAPVVGWLGADDIFSGAVRASDVMKEFCDQAIDIVVYSTEYHTGKRVTRHLSARWSQRQFLPWGFHNPHFSTFLSRPVYKEHRFSHEAGRPNQFSDITYFVDLLRNYKVTTRDEVCTYMAEGGSASGTFRAILYSSKCRFLLYKDRFGPISGVAAPVVNLAWKFSSVLKHKLRPKNCAPLWCSATARADQQ